MIFFINTHEDGCIVTKSAFNLCSSVNISTKEFRSSGKYNFENQNLSVVKTYCMSK